MTDLLLGAAARRLLKAYGWLMVAVIMLPVLIMIPVSFGKGEALLFPPRAFSFEWYERLATDHRWARAALLSLQVALVASLVATVLGTVAAIGISRLEGRAGKVAKTLFIAPMIVPLMVISVGFYILYAQFRLLGSPLPLALAHAVVVLPFVIIPVMARIVSLDPALERAAASLGATPVQTILKVILPLLGPAILAAFVFAFIMSFDEVVIAQFLSGPTFETLPRKMWEGISQSGLDKTITAISTIQLALVLLVLVAHTVWKARQAKALRKPTLQTGTHAMTAAAPQDEPGRSAAAPAKPALIGRPQGAGEQHGLGVRFEGLTKYYGNFAAVDDINLTVEPGEFVTILGPSGSGKTTLLLLIAGFVTPDRGRLMLGEREISAVPPYRRDIGMVFQSYALFPHMNVRKNVAFPLSARKLPRAEIDRQVDWALSRVHMSAYGERRITQLSGGQQQRIALARAISFNPRALLMDEPLAALDRNLRAQMQTEIRSLQRSLGQTVIFVTHDQEEALNMSDRVAVMNEGRLQQIDTPKDLYLRPNSPFVASFFGEANLFAGVADGTALDVGGTHLPLPQARRGETVLCVRPEVLRLEPAAPAGGWSISARVTDARFLGSSLRVELESALGTLIATSQLNSRAAAPDIGAMLHVSWEPALSHAMDRGAGSPTKSASQP